MKIVSVFGTRPEAIKMAPVVKTLEAMPCVDAYICLTGQHREMLTDVLDLFELKPACNLDIMMANQGLTSVTCSVLEGLGPVFEEIAPDYVLVHGDTTTTMAGALAAFYRRIPVGHVEAGLRTNNIYAPWPEEMNRKIAGAISTLHFAPTSRAAENLRCEGVSGNRITVTGNTAIDALHWVLEGPLAAPGINAEMAALFPFLDPSKRLILVTGHRRENHNGGIGRVCSAMRTVAARGDVQVVYPVHPCPEVKRVVDEVLGRVADVHLVPPLSYKPFVWLMKRSHIIVTDSGGIQEEAPSLGKPVLVTRDITERPEAVVVGTVKLVGTDPNAIIFNVARLLDDTAAFTEAARAYSPYGDGQAAARIANRLLEEHR